MNCQPKQVTNNNGQDNGVPQRGQGRGLGRGQDGGRGRGFGRRGN